LAYEISDMIPFLDEWCAFNTPEGQLLNGIIPESDEPPHFDLEESDCMELATSREIYDFIWEHVKDLSTNVFRTLGISDACRQRMGEDRAKAAAEDILRNDPFNLMEILNIALEFACPDF
jgi:hypothetical protein